VEYCLERALSWWGTRFRLPAAVELFQFCNFLTRVLLVALFVLLEACASADKPLVLPETAPGGWRLAETKHEGAKMFAVYRGPGTVHVEVEDMKVQAVAFDRAQKTRPQPDTVFFDRGRYFITVRWEQADREALKQLVRALQKLGD
jgi:hypothetical protein